MKKIKIILFSIVSLITILISCSSNELTNTKNDLEIIENEKDSIIVNIDKIISISKQLKTSNDSLCQVIQDTITHVVYKHIYVDVDVDSSDTIINKEQYRQMINDFNIILNQLDSTSNILESIQEH